MGHVFEQIFADVLLPRSYPQSFVAKINYNKTRGVLICGPPGTRKSLTARTICETLKAKPIVVRSPEILSSLVGESEKNVLA